MLYEFCANERDTLLDVASVIQRNLSRCAVITDDRDIVVGVFSEGDMLRAILRNNELHTPVKQFLNGQFIFLEKRNLAMAFEIMRQKGISLIPVVAEDFRLVDVITLNEVLKQVRFVDNE